jgi:hypothetical protein
MFPATVYVIRRALDDDAPALRELADLDSQSPIGGEALIGEIDGRPAAAISLAERRVIADPFQFTGELSEMLKMRARSLRAFQATPSLRERMLAGVRLLGVWGAKAAPGRIGMMRATRRFAAPSTFMPTSRGDSSIRWRVRRAKSAEPIAPPATTPITDGRSARPGMAS